MVTNKTTAHTIGSMARQVASAMPDLSVIVLIHNEIDSLEPLHRELVGVLEGLDVPFELLYVDDGSTDGSTQKLGQIAATDQRIRVVSFRRNFGQSAAVEAGIDYSRGKVLVFLDGDMQNDPHDIPPLLTKLDDGFDVVSGWRRNRRDRATRAIPSRIGNWIIARVTGVDLSDFGCTLKAYRREVIQDVRLRGEMHRLLPVFAAAVGARITELPVNHRPRTYGKSRHSPARASRVMLDVVAVKVLGAYATKPLYFLGFTAVAMWTVAVVLAVIAIVQRLIPPYVSAHQNAFLFVSGLLVVLGTQFMLTGLLGELAVRIQPSRVKPTYVVREPAGGTAHREPAANGAPALRRR